MQEKGSCNLKYGWIPVIAPILGGSTAAMINLALYDGIVDLRLISMIALSIITLVIVYVIDKSRLIKVENISNHSILNYNNKIFNNLYIGIYEIKEGEYNFEELYNHANIAKNK